MDSTEKTRSPKKVIMELSGSEGQDWSKDRLKLHCTACVEAAKVIKDSDQVSEAVSCLIEQINTYAGYGDAEGRSLRDSSAVFILNELWEDMSEPERFEVAVAVLEILDQARKVEAHWMQHYGVVRQFVGEKMYPSLVRVQGDYASRLVENLSELTPLDTEDYLECATGARVAMVAIARECRRIAPQDVREKLLGWAVDQWDSGASSAWNHGCSVAEMLIRGDALDEELVIRFSTEVDNLIGDRIAFPCNVPTTGLVTEDDYKKLKRVGGMLSRIPKSVLGAAGKWHVARIHGILFTVLLFQHECEKRFGGDSAKLRKRMLELIPIPG